MKNTSSRISWILSLLLIISSSAWSFGNMGGPSQGAIPHTGTVMETMSSAGYTYVRVEEEGNSFWIALPETTVTVGEEISFYEQMLMENFTSRSLNRTFDKILFVGAINEGSTLPTQAQSKPSPNKQAPAANVEPQQQIELGQPVGRFTIEDIFKQKDDLSGDVIEAKGKVSKVSRQIMGNDWVHIEDGTGTKEGQNNKIIFRADRADLAVGDEVVAKGVLYTNKDFGYGYFYPVIVENAVFTK